MKYSRQRELILNAVNSHPVHPTADTVYALLKQENPNLSLGTVYRNLNKFVEDGKLLRIQFPGEPDRFDGNLHDHYHMQCVECGTVVDIPVDHGKGFVENEVSGYQVLSCEVYLKGVCPQCQKEMERSDLA